MDNTCTIYGLCSSQDGVIRYIGQTTALVERRIREHVTAARNLANDAPVQRWIRKQLASDLEIEIVTLESNAELDVAEIRWIELLKSIDCRCLNINPGGDAGARGIKRSEVTKQKMRKPRSEETKQRMRKPKSDATRIKMSAAQTGNTKGRGENNGNTKLSNEDVRLIKKRLAEGAGVCALAREYGELKGTISKIKNGRSWLHI